MGGAFIVQLILTILFMPESAYHRTNAINIDTGNKAIVGPAGEKEFGHHVETSETSGPPSSEPARGFLRELLPYDGFYDDVSFWRTMVRPFGMLSSPVVYVLRGQ